MPKQPLPRRHSNRTAAVMERTPNQCRPKVQHDRDQAARDGSRRGPALAFGRGRPLSAATATQTASVPRLTCSPDVTRSRSRSITIPPTTPWPDISAVIRSPSTFVILPENVSVVVCVGLKADPNIAVTAGYPLRSCTAGRSRLDCCDRNPRLVPGNLRRGSNARRPSRDARDPTADDRPTTDRSATDRSAANRTAALISAPNQIGTCILRGRPSDPSIRTTALPPLERGSWIRLTRPRPSIPWNWKSPGFLGSAPVHWNLRHVAGCPASVRSQPRSPRISTSATSSTSTSIVHFHSSPRWPRISALRS